MTLKATAAEYNFDGLVGPTHNYAGLAFGNVASAANAGSISSPKQAALQGLAKMQLLMRLGIPQAVIPPHQRPNLSLLRQLGFTGNNAQLLQQAYNYQPALLAACYSAASMWTANMATVSVSCHTGDNLLHITPANLTSNLHRAQEAEFNHSLLKKIFADRKHFKIHQPLLAYSELSDEGAANHSVICDEYGRSGLEIFVYGKTGLHPDPEAPTKYPARQTRLASSTIVRQHGLTNTNHIMLQQSPKAVDAGVFHNDVIFVANKNVLLYHTQAFVDDVPLIDALQNSFGNRCHVIKITDQDLSLAEAVSTYFFNSQLVSLPNTQNMALILPQECKNSLAVQNIVHTLISGSSPIKHVEYIECRESMRNGGGPACLRLRAVLTAEQQQAIHAGIIMNEALLKQLVNWVNKNYRDSLAPHDLLDPLFIDEVYVALDQLTQILNLGSIYPFQQVK